MAAASSEETTCTTTRMRARRPRRQEQSRVGDAQCPEHDDGDAPCRAVEARHWRPTPWRCRCCLDGQSASSSATSSYDSGEESHAAAAMASSLLERSSRES